VDRFAAFIKERGFEAHGLVAEPMLVEPGRCDYRLAPGRPARTMNADALP
jgi:hypothetical protein